MSLDGIEVIELNDSELNDFEDTQLDLASDGVLDPLLLVRRELFEIRELLSPAR